jgi:germination protein M
VSRLRNLGRPFALLAGLLVLLLVGGGIFGFVLRRHTDETSTTTAAVTTPGRTDTSTSTSTLRTSVVVYFVRDGKMGAAGRLVPKTPAIGTAALDQLVAGPTDTEQAAGLSSALPAGTAVDSLDVSAGLATVKLSKALDPAATAQVVFTLTHFPSVKRVAVNGAAPQTRKELEDMSPIILVEEPTPDETVTSPFEVRGTSNTFEATLQLQLTEGDGNVLSKQFLTATSGTGTRGTFGGLLPFKAAAGTHLVLHAYEDSAEDGSRIHEVVIPLVAG